MTLLRTQIREAILRQLAEIKGIRVFDSPLYPLALQDLPAVTVTAEKETRLPDSSTVGKDGVVIHSYELPLTIEGVIQGSDHLHSQCEAIALSVMTMLEVDKTLGGLCKALYWESGAEMITASEGETPIGRVRLTATVFYRAAEGVFDQPCD
jgi:hypothetical protein